MSMRYSRAAESAAYHLVISHTIRAVMKVDMAYTSDSTAENHAESHSAKQRPPPIAAVAATKGIIRRSDRCFPDTFESDILRRAYRNAVMLTAKKIILASRNEARAMNSPLERLIMSGCISFGNGMVANFIASIQIGLPGG